MTEEEAKLLEKKNRRYRIKTKDLVKLIDSNIELSGSQIATIVSDITGLKKNRVFKVFHKDKPKSQILENSKKGVEDVGGLAFSNKEKLAFMKSLNESNPIKAPNSKNKKNRRNQKNKKSEN